jgi:hypothetical protein
MSTDPQPAFQPTNLLALAQPIAQKAQAKFLWLWDTRVARDSMGQDNLPIHNNHAFDVEYSRTSDSDVAVIVRFVWRADHKEEAGGSDLPTRIEARFIIGYEAPDLSTSSDDQVLAFAKLNGVFNAWPYWREYLQSTSSRLGLPGVMVPLLTIGTLLSAYMTHEIANAASPVPSSQEATTAK